MKIRQAQPSDAAGISEMLQEMAAQGKRNLPSDKDYVLQSYVAHPDTIRCSIALDDGGGILGLQILKRASEGNPYGVAPGWGIIGTHIHPRAARQGIGKALFAQTLAAARGAGLTKIDATIGADNEEGLGYYEAMGFRTYKREEGRICKCCALD